MFLSSRLIMNSRQLKARSLRNGVSRDFQEVFSTTDAMLFCQNTRKTAGNNAVEMSQAFHDVVRFERFTDLNLFKYAFNVIQSGQHTLYNYIQWCLFFVSSYGRR